MRQARLNAEVMMAQASLLEQAIKFWQEVQAELPSRDVERWLESLQAGRADWFRNLSLVRLAADANARKADGRFSIARYEENMAKVRAIMRKHSVVNFMQD